MMVKKYNKTLHNGQIATVFVESTVLYGYSIQEVCMVIGSSISNNKKWYNNHMNFRAVKSTGTCGLEGLLFALEVINTLKGNVVIRWTDNRRKSAYRRLTKFGFRLVYWKSHPEYGEFFLRTEGRL